MPIIRIQHTKPNYKFFRQATAQKPRNKLPQWVSSSVDKEALVSSKLGLFV